jgi:pyruvate/2-oxoglutarate/acetoin dehydrogenase E1 component
MKYIDEIRKSTEWLAKKDDTTFVGQSVMYSGNAIYNTLKTIDEKRRIEVPVFEEVQMGMCTGMAMNGLVPICCFPRFDFILRCMDSLVNHLDKMQHMTEGTFKPKVIMRTSIGAKQPLDGGIQHTQDYTIPLQGMLHEVDVVLLEEPEDIFNEFKRAYNADRSTLLVEYGDYYNEK